MLPVLLKQACGDDSHLSQEKSDDWQLEHNAHDQGERDKEVEIGIDGDVALHLFRHTVGAQKRKEIGKRMK